MLVELDFDFRWRDLRGPDRTVCRGFGTERRSVRDSQQPLGGRVAARRRVRIGSLRFGQWPPKMGNRKNNPFAKSSIAAPPQAIAASSQRWDARTIATEESTSATCSSVSA